MPITADTKSMCYGEPSKQQPIITHILVSSKQKNIAQQISSVPQNTSIGSYFLELKLGGIMIQLTKMFINDVCYDSSTKNSGSVAELQKK